MALSLEPEYLDFDNLPDTNFTCVGKVIGGYYADLETNCQMFHVCTIGQADEPMDIRFLCLNGTVFDQETRVCERIDEVDCSKSEQFYSLNLELYGNSGAILEESPEPAPETEPPSIIIKSTTPTSTTTTTTTKRPTVRPTNSPYHTTSGPSAATTSNRPQIISNHHFPVNSPDIRFNPEEINISLNAGAPPDIRTKHFLPHGFSDSSQEIVNDNVDSDEGQSDKVQNPERPHVSSSTSPKTIYSVNNNKNNEKLPDIGEVDFAYSDEEYQTEPPQQRHQQFFIQTNSFRHSQSFPPNVNYNGNHGQYHHENFHSTTAKQNSNSHQEPAHSTVRTIYLHSLKPPEVHQHHHYTHHHTEKPPQRVQIPIPLLPTLSPLTFSSPAPFSLQRHIETKRYTKDHQAPPRIIISASASVSDASGRRLNYSLGTIGAAQILKTPPSSYDEYKDSDVGLDPFYHDVPKVNQKKRKRRSTESKEEKINPFDIIKNEKEAVEVLKFLFTWYQSHQATATALPVTSPVTPDLIHKINHELSATSSDNGLLTDSSEIQFSNSKEETSSEYSTPNYKNNQLFRKNGRYSIIGGYRNLGTELKLNPENIDNDTIHAVNISFNQTEVANYSKEDNSDTPARNEKPELKEKMDDYEMTIIEDNKESYINPYDYVDDNYEGTAYKEEDSNRIKEPITDKKNISHENIHGHTETKSYSIDPKTKSELYKYFQVDSTSEMPKLTKEYEEIPNFSPHNDEFTSINNIVDDTSTITESLNNNVTSIIPDTDKVKETDKATQENISSNDHEQNISSSTSPVQPYTTTTPEPTSSRTNTIRRGRGRQRYRNDRYSERSRTEERNSNTIKSIEKNYNDISSSQSSGRRTRKRGRSRFNDPYSSTSTTIATTTAETNIAEDSPASTTIVGLDSTHSPKEILTTITNDLSEQTTIDAMVTELYTTHDGSKPDQATHEVEKEVHTDRIESLGHFTINIPDLLINSENEQKSYENDDHTESQIDPSYLEDGIKIEDLKIEKDSLNNSITKTYLSNQTALYYAADIPTESIETIDENNRSTDIELENVEVPITTPINVHFKELSSFETESEPKSDDSSYLVKLLRYFAEIALNLDSDKYNQKTEKINTTENKAIVTEEATSIYNKETKNEIRQENKENYGTHNLIEASTNLPTLRQLFETTRKTKGDMAENNEDISIHDKELFSTLRTEILHSTQSYGDTYTEEPIGATTDSPVQKLKENVHIETKAQLLEKLHLIEQRFMEKDTAISVTDPTPADTTVTTPFVSFEHPESFATTESSSTMPSSSADIHVPETHVLSIKSTSDYGKLDNVGKYKDPYSLYDEAYMVPGLDRKSTDQTNQEKVSDELSTAPIRDSTKSTGSFHDDTATASVYIDENSEIAETITMDPTTQTYAPENSLIPKQDVSLTSIKPEDVSENVHSSIQSDVEIQKSISLPVSILQTTFDVSQDVNNAQEINNLVPNQHSTDIPVSTRTKEVFQESIHGIEETTNSAVDNDVPINSSSTESYDISITETVPTSKVTSENPSINYKQEYIPSSRYPIIQEVQHNTTEILFVKDTESPQSTHSDFTTNFPSSTPVKTPGMLNSSHLLQVTVETTTTVPETTILTSTSKPYHTRKVRPPKRRPYTNTRKQFGRHRFSTELFTSKPQKHVEVELSSRINLDNITDAPLHRSATPTRSELRKVTLHTTPLSSKTTRYPAKVNRHYVFNCFGKDINKFYADPRDCRLFHYCTQGYSKNQLLDLKFVCDRRTFFDDEKLICTKVKPTRCL